MCYNRRVFYSCLHEDFDVTPPRAILYCRKVVPDVGSSRSASSSVKPCRSAYTLPLTARADVYARIVRSNICEFCAQLPGLFSNPEAWSQRRVLGEGIVYGAPAKQEEEVVDDSKVDIDDLLAQLDEAAKEQQQREDEAALFDDEDWDGDAQYLMGSAGIESAHGYVGDYLPFETAGFNGAYELCEELDPHDEQAWLSIANQNFELYDDDDDAELEEDILYEPKEVLRQKGKGPASQ
ncbi:hypothetical protein F5Y02DRAFT_420616 [Annulohypoxylon stygium]|nr:hypothetical protein F5Y02DRAFT_420616 [Annulohypoxylon stygium]